ncbi:hypothetical protein JDV02_010698 [Purpureocillium takamizusanense]|uniref:SHSP domain-containing protein n=1 Tax=Purpureocillium takamizusanense TaxID=2060973 RepID=A0A9Q8QTG6_9HYPO|nr:uncharacterized protein JDV02_010698 [Purpureocillium takamizusanense]UNI24986.1 hypothetical protein JDV02_010698 [Purpureocillium takamizusanense]
MLNHPHRHTHKDQQQQQQQQLVLHICRSTTLPQTLSRNLKRPLVQLSKIIAQTRAMAFFPRNFYNPDASFAPLFRLLDEFDAYSRPASGSGSGNGNHRRESVLSIWQPKFDVRETVDEYELHGELPGVYKEQVQIEFTEPQTMVVRGRVERSYTSGTPPAAGLVKGAPASKAIAEGGDEQSHHATVEEEGEAPNTNTYSITDVASQKTDAATNREPSDTAKYWLSERTVGEFSRTFGFPGSIDQGAVTASFKDGILSIVVPKAKKQGSRQIAIN